ncbi:putative transcription factor WD40-like family [Medicago truncatula]|uniref:Putative transcription factor WD40-like family n=1 Tax=Medicago truncatula TaxID=3880 RepID=G7JWN6_MEDTR|nr:mitotic checkpoint protein BUB3.3 isoform X2 [Medicago truncatula]XP_024640937.1 mitotic checkpoint protein BUB3.3 isoform X2 [Medicago truncatula]XP_039690510.1 mitotic checkpoint protein BUB3.3 isoform X2 [Medicago truncatula]AES96908.2 transducin/WD40 repeat protein [Medicago truncatula]RHN55477.1 putative transcription factor WD40-like family [Medicago truncatula]
MNTKNSSSKSKILSIPIGDAISRIQFGPNSNNLLISSWDTNLRLYDFDASVVRLEANSEASLLDCCFSEDDSVAFSVASDGFIRRYDLHSGIVDPMGSHDDMATCIGYSNETCLLITSGFDKKLLSWDIRTKKAFSLSMSLDAEIDSMSVSGFMVTVGIGASVHVYDLRNFDKPNLSMEPCNGTQLRCVSSIPYAEGFAVGSVDGRVALQVSNSSNSNDIGYTFRCHPKSKDGQHHLASVNNIAFSPLMSGAFVTGDDEGYATIWDARSRKRLIEFPRYSNSVASLSYNHSGQLLAVASSYTFQEAKEIVEPPQVFIHKVDNIDIGSSSARRKT